MSLDVVVGSIITSLLLDNGDDAHAVDIAVLGTGAALSGLPCSGDALGVEVCGSGEVSGVVWVDMRCLVLD